MNGHSQSLGRGWNLRQWWAPNIELLIWNHLKFLTCCVLFLGARGSARLRPPIKDGFCSCDKEVVNNNTYKMSAFTLPPCGLGIAYWGNSWWQGLENGIWVPPVKWNDDNLSVIFLLVNYHHNVSAQIPTSSLGPGVSLAALHPPLEKSKIEHSRSSWTFPHPQPEREWQVKLDRQGTAMID